MLRLSAIFLCVALTSGAYACQGEAWHSVPPVEFWASQHVELAATSYREVAPAERARALSLLEGRGFVPLTSAEAAALSGTQAPPVQGIANLHLLRALRLSTTNSAFAIFQASSGEVAVSFQYLGSADGPPQRTALVVALNQVPAKLYISCRGAK